MYAGRKVSSFLHYEYFIVPTDSNVLEMMCEAQLRVSHPVEYHVCGTAG